MNPPLKPNLDIIKRDRHVRARMCVVTSVLVLGFTAVTARLYFLHVRQHAEFSELAARMRQLHQPLPAHRGSIRDRDGELLAHDETVHELYIDRVHLDEKHLVRRKLATIRGTTVADLRKEMSDEQINAAYREHVATTIAPDLQMPLDTARMMLASKKPVTVFPGIFTDEEAATWRKLLAERHITGVYLRPTFQRAYPAKERLTHVLGDMNFSHGGAWGVEAMMDTDLDGTDGEQWIERDNKGRELPLYRGKVIEPKHGSDTYLTIDMSLQDYVEQVIEQQCAIWSPKKLTIIITDPRTGSILAMASRPHYERDSKSGMLRNLAISDPYEPGSTFKLVTLAAALDLGKVAPDTSFALNNGYYEEPAQKIKLTDHHPLANGSVETILVHSSNIGAYKVARTVGQDDFLAYIWRFGFGQKTGIGLKGEGTGLVKFDNWSGTTMSRMAMGYEVSVTPLQLAMVIGAFANGGVLMKPRLIDRVVSADGENIRVTPSMPQHQICKARTIAQINKMLCKVVTETTGKKAAIEGITVAGKTGTAWRYDEATKGYQDGHYIASFAGFAPAEDPRIACVVVVDDPKAGTEDIFGGTVAAPIFSEVVRAALDQLSVHSERSFVVRVDAPGGDAQ